MSVLGPSGPLAAFSIAHGDLEQPTYMSTSRPYGCVSQHLDSQKLLSSLQVHLTVVAETPFVATHRFVRCGVSPISMTRNTCMWRMEAREATATLRLTI